ncbi:hypothetical protein MRB53_010259 [Persea americana]|uniref:Uncharacterized protein n=1 Tax=Persea americana TaxID=3435 RepID=A0ACC2LRG2_PERAE|nr:hypothetical protein MRB53_010259 [Persea americana]
MMLLEQCFAEVNTWGTRSPWGDMKRMPTPDAPIPYSVGFLDPFSSNAVFRYKGQGSNPIDKLDLSFNDLQDPFLGFVDSIFLQFFRRGAWLSFPFFVKCCVRAIHAQPLKQPSVSERPPNSEATIYVFEALLQCRWDHTIFMDTLSCYRSGI